MPATADLGQPLAALLRGWVADHQHPDLVAGLDHLAATITATTPEVAREREHDQRSQPLTARRAPVPPERLFPPELLQATIDLAAVPDDARVALTYRPGYLSGTIGGAPVEVHEPDGSGLWHPHRTGIIAGKAFDVAWTKTQTPRGITDGVKLTGTFADAPVELNAGLHPGPEGSFGHGTIRGVLGDHPLHAEIHALEGGLGARRGIEITGTLGEMAVELFADLVPERRLGAVIRGTVPPQPGTRRHHQKPPVRSAHHLRRLPRTH